MVEKKKKCQKFIHIARSTILIHRICYFKKQKGIFKRSEIFVSDEKVLRNSLLVDIDMSKIVDCQLCFDFTLQMKVDKSLQTIDRKFC